MAPDLDSLNQALWRERLCPQTDTAGFLLHISRGYKSLHEDSLLSSSVLILAGVNPDSLSPQQRNAVERYAQAGGGIFLADMTSPSPYTWPWLTNMLAGPKADTLEPQQMAIQRVSLTDSLTSPADVGAYYEFNGGRIARIDSLPLFWEKDQAGLQLAQSLRYLIGSNSYDHSLCQTPLAPEFSRFTRKVLDANDIDEPMELTVLPDGRVLFIERKGKMKLYLPSEEKTKTIFTFDVCTTGNYEDGLLGLTQDPDFAKNGFIYLYYSPGADCLRPQTLSRFQLEGDSLLRNSEQVIIEVDVQRETCCHSGGSVTFGPNGYLWLSTGDNTSSKESDGYTPIDEREGRGPFDAQKSSGNTHDLRGKILRISLTDSATYTIPDGNLFPKDGSKGRPEIYTMGCRNPFRFSVDSKTGWVYWGDVGPDVGKAGKYGPESFDEWNQAKTAGNYGWPYFIGDNYAYPDRDFATDTLGALFNPIQPVNYSPHNTGSRQLPPARPAMIWYPYGVSDSFPMLGQGSRSAMAGPVYHRGNYPDSSMTAFPAYYEDKLFIYEWARSWIMVASFDTSGNLNQVEPFLPQMPTSKPIDMEFGPDGSMYYLDYGENYFANNPDAKLVKLEFSAGNRLPVPEIFVDESDGAAPHTANLSAYYSFDYDPEDSVLQYFWQLSQDSLIEDSGVEICYTFDQPGIYRPTLIVVDQQGDTAISTTEIRVGNAPPQIDIAWEGNRTFYFAGEEIPYEVSVRDPEDEAANVLSPQEIETRWVYANDGNDLQVMLGEGEVPQGDPRFYQGLMLIRNSDCKTCHQLEKASVGPSYQEIAERYAGQASARDMLAKKIINGGNGNWGERMMAAHPQLSLPDTRAMTDYILSLNNPAAAGSKPPLKGKLTLQASNGPEAAYLFAATYTDKGKGELPPLTQREMILLKNPRMQAENFDFASDWISVGVVGARRNQEVIFGISDQAFIAYRKVDGTGLKSLRLHTQPQAGGQVSVFLDHPKGELVGKGYLSARNGESMRWEDLRIPLTAFEGIHDLYLVFSKPGSNEQLMILDWVEVSRK